MSSFNGHVEVVDRLLQLVPIAYMPTKNSSTELWCAV